LSTARAVLQVTWLLAARPEGVRADEVAEALGKSVSTAYNLLASLCDEDVAAHAFRLGARRRFHHGGDAALHIEGAAAMELVAVDDGIERIAVVAVDRNRIDVAIEHQRAATARPFGDADDRRPTWMIFQPMHLEAALGQPGAAEIRDPSFSRPARHEVGVDRVDCHQLLQKLDRIVAHRPSRTCSGVRPTSRV